jgi:hypothetical protein
VVGRLVLSRRSAARRDRRRDRLGPMLASTVLASTVLASTVCARTVFAHLSQPGTGGCGVSDPLVSGPVARGALGASAEHFIAPDRDADDQHQQRHGGQADRHVDQGQLAGDRTGDQEADRDSHNRDDRAEPDHLIAPVTPEAQSAQIALPTVVLSCIRRMEAAVVRNRLRNSLVATALGTVAHIEPPHANAHR